jgi:GNAT superfamily N-acetyltransferase
MRVIDLTPEHEPLYNVCLEDWSDEIRDAADHKARWTARMKERGLRVKLALEDDGEVGGMIQYVPIEHAPALGRDLYMVLCIWVHGHKQGRGDHRGHGLGTALLSAAEDDARALGAQALVTWGMALPVFMRASWFRRKGYRPVDRMGFQVLLWKPFTQAAERPRWVRPAAKPKPQPGVVTVTAFISGWCPAQNMVYERARRAAEALGDRVRFEGIATDDRETFLHWGIADGLFVDGKQIRTGPPPSYAQIETVIARRLRRL